MRALALALARTPARAPARTPALTLALAASLALALPAQAQTTCRQALALGLDVSGSVDGTEYRQQLDGLATALGDPQVTAALLGLSGAPVRIAVYEWSDPRDSRLVLDWTEVTDHAAVTRIQSTLRRTERTAMRPSTGLGAALETGLALLAQQPDCWQHTLDISGDGKGNVGRRPQDVEDPTGTVTINGLVIGADDARGDDDRAVQVGELAAYFTAYVIRGPDAFVETALGFEDYADAMRRKLLRELAVLAIGQVMPAD